METDSLLSDLAAVDRALAELLDGGRPAASGPWETAHTVCERLVALTETLAAVDHVPSLPETPPAAADERVANALDARLDERLDDGLRTDGGPGAGDDPGSVSPDETETTAPDETAVVEAERLAPDGDGHAVPLGKTWPRAANWYVLYPWLAERLRALERDCRRCRQRLDATDAGRVTEAFADLSRMLTELASVLDRLPAVALWLDPPDALAAAEFEEIESFLQRVLAAGAEGSHAWQ
ncbi:hypothetical protein RYH80_08185 [Halobaculum sp. MBLA0147]|uniref:hypothetical protein n=1 Tax=Halobaculum sp. MBLA0147 TaxID=3079934 RepID=UPI0035251F75